MQYQHGRATRARHPMHDGSRPVMRSALVTVSGPGPSFKSFSTAVLGLGLASDSASSARSSASCAARYVPPNSRCRCTTLRTLSTRWEGRCGECRSRSARRSVPTTAARHSALSHRSSASRAVWQSRQTTRAPVTPARQCAHVTPLWVV